MICRHKQFVAALASLVIILAQFGVLLHATDHPFHQKEPLCFSFQCAQHDNALLQGAPAVLAGNSFIIDIDIPSTGITLPSFNASYSSRAPPVFII